jgi:flagellar hook-associated protein 1 FlgK
MSLTGLLGIARSALAARQAQLNVTGNNIANANTEGYSRQRVRLAAAPPQRTAQGQLGTGVRIEGIERARSAHLDASLRAESGVLGEFQTLRDRLGEVEAAFGEPSDTGLAATLDAFWSSWSDLANDPTGAAARTMVRARGRQLAGQLNDLGRRLTDVQASALDEMRRDVSQANGLTKQLANLNRQIAAAESGNRVAPDLRDARDRLIDQLATALPVRVIDRGDGTVSVFAGDAMVVDGGTSRDLAVRATSGGGFSIEFADTTRTLDIGGGRLKAGLDLTGTQVPAIRRQLDDLVQAIVTTVNALHQTGYTRTGLTGTDFFAPTGVNADTIALTSAVESSADAVAAGTTGAPGDGTLALAIAGLRDAPLPLLGGLTAASFYTDVVTAVGAAVADAGRLADSQDLLVSQLETQRSSVSGVSVDEELINLIAYQQAYVAATRVVSAADQMMQELLRMV